ncbi:MAG: hypothetical protein P9X24_17085, partial [Candidatus Hatepunaea meridiana]|nr:hypothetical protein [Candidatus Hatepunaea meridiana]
MTEQAKYIQSKQECNQCIDLIIGSTSWRKIVVAGPGTGKTYLFKKIIGQNTNCLTLTFVTALVKDLALELYGLSEVRTLHGFARKELVRLSQKDKEYRIYPNLPSVISEDAFILLSKSILCFGETYVALRLEALGVKAPPTTTRHISFYRFSRSASTSSVG